MWSRQFFTLSCFRRWLLNLFPFSRLFWSFYIHICNGIGYSFIKRFGDFSICNFFARRGKHFCTHLFKYSENCNDRKKFNFVDQTLHRIIDQRIDLALHSISVIFLRFMYCLYMCWRPIFNGSKQMFIFR